MIHVRSFANLDRKLGTLTDSEVTRNPHVGVLVQSDCDKRWETLASDDTGQIHAGDALEQWMNGEKVLSIAS